LNSRPQELSWSQVHAVRLERHHLVRRAAKKDLSFDGKVAGTWTHVPAGGTLRITVDPFPRLGAKTTADVRRKAESLAETLGLAKAEVRFA
jgi:hypothetical protein